MINHNRLCGRRAGGHSGDSGTERGLRIRGSGRGGGRHFSGGRARAAMGWDGADDDTLFDSDGPRHGDRRGGGRGVGRGHGGRFGPRRGRAMDAGGLQLLLLSLLNVEPRHGYELIRAIEEMSEGHYVPSPGMVYPSLAFLEEAGDICVASPEEAGSGRKSFIATDNGRARLAAQAAQLAEVEARLAALAGQSGPDAADAAVQPIRRAMHNLRAVLMARVSSGEMPTELQHRIVDIIDDAAKHIERIN